MTFEELSRAGPESPSDAPQFSSRPSPRGTGALTPEEREHLKTRVAEARVRTMELIARYFDLYDRSVDAVARSREMLARREEDRAALGASVSKYALLLRELGEPPERTLVLIKTAFSEAAPHQGEMQRAVLEDLVKWIVDAYYAA